MWSWDLEHDIRYREWANGWGRGKEEEEGEECWEIERTIWKN